MPYLLHTMRACTLNAGAEMSQSVHTCSLYSSVCCFTLCSAAALYCCEPHSRVNTQHGDGLL